MSKKGIVTQVDDFRVVLDLNKLAALPDNNRYISVEWHGYILYIDLTKHNKSDCVEALTFEQVNKE